MKIIWFVISVIAGNNTGRNIINGGRLSRQDYTRAIHLIVWMNQPVVMIALSMILLFILGASILGIITVEGSKRAIILMSIIISGVGLISLIRISELSPTVVAKYKQSLINNKPVIINNGLPAINNNKR